MIPIPRPEDYDVSPVNGFLPLEPPLVKLPDPYYEPWENVVKNLQGLLLSDRLEEQVDRMPILSTERLVDEPQWRRAYSLLAFLAHAYIWGGKKPSEWIPPTITLPFQSVCQHLELPPVATYAGLVLWNWKPIFGSEPSDSLSNLDMIDTFTGSLDEKWFYLVSVAIEAKGAPLIPLMLDAIQAANRGDRGTVSKCLQVFAEQVDLLGQLLARMYDHCDPHVFYHRLRPYLAGGKNMADAGLPNGVVFDNGGPINKQRYVQYSGGSNAQSSLIQFLDIVLGVEHHPTRTPGETESATPFDNFKSKSTPKGNSFIHEMREYMPGPHARFLRAVARVSNIHSFVQTHAQEDRGLALAFDASLAMLSALRDRHMQIVSRYIVIKSGEAKRQQQKKKPAGDQELIFRIKPTDNGEGDLSKKQDLKAPEKQKDLVGTGGSSLVQFLRQARDETKNRAVDSWTRKLLMSKNAPSADAGSIDEQVEALGQQEMVTKVVVQGLASVWKVEDSMTPNGGICWS